MNAHPHSKFILAGLLLAGLLLCSANTLAGPPEAVPMKVQRVMLIDHAPAVLLLDHKEQRYLMLFVDIFMATAIRMGLHGVAFERPLTHDLIGELLKVTGSKVNKVVITELKDTTYYALITLEVNARTVVLDSRPSDALAIAVRGETPIYVHADLLKPVEEIPGPHAPPEEGHPELEPDGSSTSPLRT